MNPEKKALILGILGQAKELLFDEDIEDDETQLLMMTDDLLPPLKKQRVCIKDYVEVTVERYSNDDFKSHFRLKRTTFELLESFVRERMCKTTGRPPMDTRKKLLSVLWLLGNQESFRSVADRFDLSKGMLHDNLKAVCHLLVENASKFISWPTDLLMEEQNFREICGFPGVVGAIDGSHIPIKAPKDNPDKYFNRKNFFSLILQGVATADLLFTHVYCAYPGSVHDARVFLNSEVNGFFNDLNYFPSHCHLIGDAAYPLNVNLLVPYKNNGQLGPRQLNYNKKLSKTRVCIERAFGLLKGRFRRLKFFDAKVVDIPLYVVACCTLHNICLKEQDFIQEEMENIEEEEDDDNDADVSPTAINKRDYICGML